LKHKYTIPSLHSVQLYRSPTTLVTLK
jgi:hypothetical protein